MNRINPIGPAALIAVLLIQVSAGMTPRGTEAAGNDNAGLTTSQTVRRLEPIRLSRDRTQFLRTESGSRFVAWGFNYDHDRTGRLIEDYWQNEWETVVQDFNEMKQLGANLVRVHLQVAKFVETPQKTNEAALKKLACLVELAEKTGGLYLDITGLGCYHKKDVPEWYDDMDEDRRWSVQTLFWEAVAKTCSASDAVFCYDLMNEPILPGENEKKTDWLAGEFGGKHFVQYITLDLDGRTRKQVARDWVNRLVAAIRKHDKSHMITVGVIPWAHTFPNAKPLFYSEEVSENLDIVSVHFYPKKGEVDKALAALEVYKIAKPLLIEETFPLWCGRQEFDAFVEASRSSVDGYLGFYWGATIEDYSRPDIDIGESITRDWLQYFRMKGTQILMPDGG